MQPEIHYLLQKQQRIVKIVQVERFYWTFLLRSA